MKKSFLSFTFLIFIFTNINLLYSQNLQGDENSAFTLLNKIDEESQALEKKGELIKALKLIPQMYELEAPVDSFYTSLDKRKINILKQLSQKKSKDNSQNIIGDLLHYFVHLMSKADSMKQICLTEKDLPPKYFLYLNLLSDETKNQEDLPLYLQSHDPWLVAAAMFMARKNEQIFIPQEIIDRWEKRPDMWDDRCDEQALLYLALFPSEIIENLIVKNKDITLRLQDLQITKPDTCVVQPLLILPASEIRFKSSITSPAMKYLMIKDLSSKSKKEEKATKFKHNDYLLSLEKGSYSLRYNSITGSRHGESSGMMGKSKSFKTDNGLFIRVCLPSEGGI